MKSYLTISEFASLRNVNINSLRYYEKLGILVPAFIEPQTKYRYYLPDQLILLDLIVFATKIGFPLKELKKYIEENGSIDNNKLLNLCRKKLSEEITSLQSHLNGVEFMMDTLQQNDNYNYVDGLYKRKIKKRDIIYKNIDFPMSSVVQFEKTAFSLFHYALQKEMSPIFPAGIMFINETPSVYFPILNSNGSAKNVTSIPQGEYVCLQIDISPKDNVYEVLNDYLPVDKSDLVIINKFFMNKLSFNDNHTEIQVLKNS